MSAQQQPEKMAAGLLADKMTPETLLQQEYDAIYQAAVHSSDEDEDASDEDMEQWKHCHDQMMKVEKAMLPKLSTRRPKPRVFNLGARSVSPSGAPANGTYVRQSNNVVKVHMTDEKLGSLIRPPSKPRQKSPSAMRSLQTSPSSMRSAVQKIARSISFPKKGL